MKQTAVIHEVQATQHRIVIINEDSTNVAGEWVPSTEVAHSDKYFAIMGESVLPGGVFTVREVAHQVLS